ncbi:MAG TPA: DUF5666 domain-containing protein [Acidimicrobiales bacterium]|jgi:hypothetical protein|nr:DUF5666 domain-containing protein [Acidimicrobiales bacterium]
MNNTPKSTTPASRVGLTRFSPRRTLALSALGLAAVVLAACGSSSASTTTSTAASSAAAGRGGASGTRQFPGTSGSIAAINGTSLEVQNATTGQTTVSYTSTTTFDQTVAATGADVTVGSCISAFGKPTSSSSKQAFGEPVTATTVSITQPTSGSCTGGFGGAGGAGGFGRGGAGGAAGGRPAGGEFPGGGSGRRPAGGRSFRGGAAGFGAASGSVTAVNGSTVTVSEANPQTKKTSSVVVTLTPSTTYTQHTTAAASDLAVGKCATAVGTADTTGAVTARSITISTPGANGCSTGFGGFRGGAAGAGGATAGGATGA